MKRLAPFLTSLILPAISFIILASVTGFSVNQIENAGSLSSTGSGGIGSSILLTVHTNLPIQNNFLGVNAVYHGFAFMDEQVTKGMTDTDRTREFGRVISMGLNIARTWYRPDYTCGSTWDSCLEPSRWITTTNRRLAAFYQWLDEMKKDNVDVALQAGWWLSDVQEGNWGEQKPFNAISYTLGITGYARWVSRSISEIVVSKGYTNVKYLIILTEPTQDSDSLWPGYVKAVQAVHQRLIADGLHDQVKLIGPNNAKGNVDPLGASHLLSATVDLNTELDIYSGHWYDQVYETWNALCNRMMRIVAPTGKSVWLDEFGHWAPAAQDEVVRGTGRYGNYIAQAVAACMNAGVQNVMLWNLFDQQYVTALATNTDENDSFYDGVQRWGTCYWPHDTITQTDSISHQVITLTDTTYCRPSWYALSMMSKYLGGRGDTKVYSTTSAAGVYLSAVKRSDGYWSFLVVNGSDFDQAFTVNFSPPLTTTIPYLYRYLYDPTRVLPSQEAKLIGYDKTFADVTASFSDSIPAQAVAIYSGFRGEIEPARATTSTIVVTSSLNSGPGSLRQAMANLQSGGTISFSSDVQLIPLTSGALVITKSMTINGPGSDRLIINGLKRDRVFDIKPGAAVVISGLTIADSSAHRLAYWPGLSYTTWRSQPEGGGGIRNAGVLTLTNCVLRGNEADYGGAMHNDQEGRVTISTSRFFSNSAASDGGAIYNFGQGEITIEANSVISNNRAGVGGGGILNWADGVVTLKQATVMNNTARYGGGGIYNGDHGRIGMTSTLIAANQITPTAGADSGGGGIRNDDQGQVWIFNSQLVSNTSDAYGGGIYNGGGASGDAGIITVTRSGLASNSAAKDGGGIYNGGHGRVTVAGTTIGGGDSGKGNTAAVGGGGILNWGAGAVEIQGSTLAFNRAAVGGAIENGGDEAAVTLTNTTVSQNSAVYEGGGLVSYVSAPTGTVKISFSSFVSNTVTAQNAGGSIHNYYAVGQVEIDNSIVAYSQPGKNCSGHINSRGYNLTSDGTCDFTSTQDMTNTDPLLSILQNNGGSTLTHIPRLSSPVIDHGDNAGCPDTDQRGVSRPQGSRCDIGAVEIPFIFLPMIWK